MSSEFKLHALAALITSVLACGAVQAEPGKAGVARTPAASASPCHRVEMGQVVRIAVGKSSLIHPQNAVSRMLLGNPQNSRVGRPSEDSKTDDDKSRTTAQQNQRTGAADVDVLLLSPTEIYVLGKSIGSTNVLLVDRTGLCTMLDIVVGMDTAGLSASFKELMPGEADLKITSAADSVVLSGSVRDAEAVDRVVEIANAYVRGTGSSASSNNPRVINMLEVAAPQQVMLEVKVAEISKSLLDQFGLDFTRALMSSNGSLRFFSGLFGGNGLLTGQLSGAAGGVGLGVTGSVSNSSNTVSRSVPGGVSTSGGSTSTATGTNMTTVSSDAQKQDGLVKILAEPTVMAISGQEGSFLAGGKIFIPVSSNSNGSTSVTLEEKEFGVSLKFTPTVLSGGRINLRVTPEVSELSAQGVAITASTVSGTSILPAFTTRRASTTVQLRDGQSFAIGGLIKNNVTSSIAAFPFLGELPVIGALFRSTSFQNDRSELVFVITPHLVKPLPENYPLPTDAYVPPSRYDMIMGGKQEGSRSDDDSSRNNPDPAKSGSDLK
ncbi:pilus assembly protein N-terminal domain-containing protein [Uliginosibacterium sp. 31-16]|uniref:type II and III secretion system protein family protein n=1 Tax=Uliginosibacterium sp. 31-16 TaxID=3068315 RepID=UPI00273F20E4|nr:pilus assembly protein N-terminal domain-containing protein [Uliginosibacterium sp. 31-16]MDP5238037.1 pilus assembly protein N-terminal domain-containing protein [Uliginosibacterium sp. 31-16]